MKEQEKRHDWQSRIRLKRALLFVLLGIACAFCLCALQRNVYGEDLRRQGVWLISGGLVLLLAFFPLWIVQRRDINNFLLEEYGEECCNPMCDMELKTDAAPNPEPQASPAEKT